MTDSTSPAAAAAEPQTTDAVPDPEPAAAPDPLAAAAAGMRRTAQDQADTAAALREEAGALMTAARAAHAEADRILADAAKRERVLASRAADAEKIAADLEMRAQWVDNGVRMRDDADAADLRAASLEAEAETVETQIRDQTSTVADLTAGRARTAAALDAARDAADLDAITTLRGQLAAAEDLIAALNGRLTAARARLDAIGDGEHRGELADARQKASGHRGSLRRALNQVWPDRAEAIADAARDKERAFQAFVAGQAAERRQPHRTIIR